MSFRVGQYNVFANYLANNFRPWHWYGYRGVSNVTNQLEGLKLKVWGKGRSKLQENFWCLIDKYGKLFDSRFPYHLDKIEKYSKKNPSRGLIHGLHSAIEAFFYRNNLTSPIGICDTTPCLFDRSNFELKLWNKVTRHVGLDLPEDHEVWDSLTKLKEELAEEKDSNEVRHKLDRYNELLRDSFGSDTELCIKIRKLAVLMSPNDRDLNEIIKWQKAFKWENRAPNLIYQTKKLKCDVWGFEELDELEHFRANLKNDLVLAVFKHRKTDARGDGDAIFYNPNTFKIELRNGQLPIGYVRYSGAAKINGEKDLRLREGPSFLYNHVILPEETPVEYIHKQASHNVDTKIEAIPAWRFTEKISGETSSLYDERVGIFVILKHKESKQNFLFMCTHLYHTQNNERNEKIREEQIKQLLDTLAAFRTKFKCWHLPAILLGDLNEVPNMKCFGKSGISKVYSQLLEEGFHDIFAEHSEPTSTNVARSVNIDYIWTQKLKRWKTRPDPKMPIRCLAWENDEKMCLLPAGVSSGAIVCPPMPAIDLGGIEKQDAIPSDHIPICTSFTKVLPNEDANRRAGGYRLKF